MSDGIKMSFSEVEGYAKKFNSEAEALQRTISNMYRYVRELQAGWNGEAAKGFEEKLNSLKKGFDNTQQVISDISSNLNKSAQEMRDFDQRMGQGWKS